jgi:gamma-glutamyltranspeptidase/glutathione hydrolase
LRITRLAFPIFCLLVPVLGSGSGSPLASSARAATPPPLRVARAAVASDHPLASAAGVAALKAGGNAVDAACAAALVLGVVHPDASGIGGGGFALVHIAKDGQTRALDFRERAPAALTAASFLKDGKPIPGASARGGLAVGVPGEVRGLAEMVRRWGALPFRRCVDPAARLAARGFPVSWRLAQNIAGVDAKAAGEDRRLIELFAAKPVREGDVIKRPDLAWTLGKLRGGADAFYKGEIAAEIVKAVRAAGGVMTAEDLAAYTVVERAPVEMSFRGLRVASMPPPSSGGVALIETLGTWQARHPSDADVARLSRGSSAALHPLVEALKHGFADRARHLGDPDFVQVDVARLIDPRYHAELGRRIKPDAVLPRDAYGTLAGAPAAPPRDGGTAHLSVIDDKGNAVALTSTVNLGFGAHLVAGKTGIVLNNEMDDFSIQAGVPNAFGLIGNEQNAVAPGKRPLSSMTPTIALDAAGKVRVVVGAAGGPTIISSVAQVLLNVVDFKLDAEAAICAPRVHHQWFPDVLSLEADIPRDVGEALERRGHKTRTSARIGTVNLLVKTEAGIEAAAEPRSPSQPAGY